jgi:tRNA(fMet)-specific endonuclease VapC
MIADTTFLIDILRGEPRARKAYEKIRGTIKTTRINQYEVYLGIHRLSNRVDFEKKLAAAEGLFDSLEVIDLDKEGMQKAARIAGNLIKEGLPIEDNDCLIIGIALSKGDNSILSNNKKHFQRIKGISVTTY